jgi:hypothetical protein
MSGVVFLAFLLFVSTLASSLICASALSGFHYKIPRILRQKDQNMLFWCRVAHCRYERGVMCGMNV